MKLIKRKKDKSNKYHKIGKVCSSIAMPLELLLEYNLKQDFIYNKEDNTYSITKENYEDLLKWLKVIQKANEDNFKSLKLFI